MKFAHIADCHLGCWRQPEMQQLNLEAFEKAIDRCISEAVDFVLLAGDLFDTALPSVDILKSVASKLRQLRNKNIGCYIIHGSHDFSASGKSMISVLEKAGLCEDVAGRLVETEKGNAVLFGLAGKKGSLEQQEILNMKNEISGKIKEVKKIKKDKMAILLAHTTISELTNLPSQVASLSLNDLPAGFDYYALGHIHQKKINEDENGKTLAYAGALFPANFSELEEQHESNFFIIETGNKITITKENIKQISEQIKSVVNIKIDANGESPLSLKEKILAEFEKNKNLFRNAVVTLRIAGELKTGRPSAVDFNSIEQQAKQLGIYCLLRNTAKLVSREFELEIDDFEAGAKLQNIGELEQLSFEAAIKENIISEKNRPMVELLLKHLVLEKAEGETSVTFSSRLTKDIVKVLGFEEEWG